MSRAPTGRLDAAGQELVAQLASLVSEERRRLQLVDYRQAEEDCERLASALLAEVGACDLERFAFRPIPRGGLIVMGMLAYLLDLPAERLTGDQPVRGPLVLVDDCALTGARFAAAFRASEASEVIFAHLRSPVGLRAAIERREPRVRRCLAANDLVDHSASMTDSERAKWRGQWERRLGSDRYYVGDVEPVAFAWSEPDRLLWNRASGLLEAGWRLASPSECLRTKGRLGPPAGEPAMRQWRAAPGAASADVGDGVWLCNTKTGEVVALEGTAAEMWRRLARHGDPRLAAVELAGSYDVDAAVLRRDIDTFAGRLAEHGLFESVALGVDDPDRARDGASAEP